MMIRQKCVKLKKPIGEKHQGKQTKIQHHVRVETNGKIITYRTILYR